MNLCIAMYALPGPSETFIADHIRYIAPGATILLCNDPMGIEEFSCSVLSPIDVWHPPRTVAERIANSFQHRRRTYFRAGMGLTNTARIIAYLQRHQVDVMLAEYGPIGCLLAYACRRAGVRLFVHFHGFDASMMLRDWRQVYQYKLLFSITSGIVVPSRFLADRLAEIGCPAHKLQVIPYGVDTQMFAPAAHTKPQLIVAVGRLVEKKAPHLSIRAFAGITHHYPQARLDVVGDGPLADQCRALIGVLGLNNRIRMLGVQSRSFVAQLMQKASLFVQHSVTAVDGDTEGLPVAVLEAMASGLPVISTRHAGIPEAVTHGGTGVLVAERDVDAMARAMGKLLGNPARAAAMGAAGRQRALACFTREMACDRLRAIMGIGPFNEEDPAFGNLTEHLHGAETIDPCNAGVSSGKLISRVV